MTQYHTQISQYFRQSLVDADKLCPADKDILPALGPDKQQDPKGDYLAIHQSAWQQGSIDPTLAEQIFSVRQKRNKPPLQQIEIVIFPRVDHLIYQGGAYDARKRKILLPLVVFANLQRDGILQPTNKAPWIPRIWISPSQSATKPFTEMALLDDFFTQHPFEGINSWAQLTIYCSRLLCHTTGQPYRAQTEQQTFTQLSELEISDEYDMSTQSLLQLNTPVVGAKSNILKVLDFLLDSQNFPKLYQAYCNRKNAVLTPFESKQECLHTAKQHVGQMSGEFPLSNNQRNSLHYTIEQKSGDILAVNGPPGTGKTTLLRSVVANLWTQAALNKSEPPLIVATSNNNQAVTNILESFARIDETGLDNELKGRWIPEVDSYGLYFCSSVKAKQKNQYRYSGPKGEGCMAHWQTQDFIEGAEEYYLEKVSQWQRSKCQSVDEALASLHREMKLVEKKIHQGIEIAEQKTASKKKQELLDLLSAHWANRSWSINWLVGLVQILLRKSLLIILLKEKINCVKYFHTQLDNWMTPSEKLKLISKTVPDKIVELIDRYYRLRLFKLSTHYYEARWLKETRAFVESNDEDKKSSLKLLRKLRRYAKLTPCFVSTFYMVPNTFMAGEFKDNTWMDLPQLEEIDLLIVDEAGQAVPDVSAASFALAKKALIVGDTFQIEPVWSIPASVDRSNLMLFDLLKDEQDYKVWLDSGLLASSGNLMRVAQRQCHYHQHETLQRGLYLTEHRRCFDDIVGYCNDLVYQGELEPLRGMAQHQIPWGTMALQPVCTPSKSYGGSRGNLGEAQTIAQWPGIAK